MRASELYETARDVVAKTILAADESTNTITKRLATIGLNSTPEVNRQYRQLLFTTPLIEQCVSGVILYEETIRQTADDNISFPELLVHKAIVPGIKVDKGAVKIEEASVNTITLGLEDLPNRLQEYRKLGARFAKWRAVYTIAEDAPSTQAIERNAQDLALYAALCQDAGIVPIVEPEVLMEGAHSIAQNKEITSQVLVAVFHRLHANQVDLQGIILKPNMVTSGSESTNQATVEEVATATLEVLTQIVPPQVPGIAFLSGGQTPDLATEHLNTINKIARADPKKYPWRLTASFGRALQGEAQAAWGGKPENVASAQKAFLARAEKIYKASLGKL